MRSYYLLNKISMKIIEYKSEQDLINSAIINKRSSDVYSCDISISFRIYNHKGNTLEFHVFYKK